MLVAPLPSDEHARLETLYALRLLDTPPEERFDSITLLASEIFNVPMAFVSLIDRERQWMKSRVGLTVCETSRELSFCSHAILGEEVLVIPDTHRDPRFADNPLVSGEPFLRFYAGQPLRAPGGKKIGTLCIADQTPHEFSAQQEQVLRRLGSLIERELRMGDLVEFQRDLLTTQEELLKTRERLQLELQAAATYIKSLLPPPVRAPLWIDWRYIPSDLLGGDCLGYHFLEGDKLAFYVLDVCGHGVEAAMLGVSLLNILRSQSLPDVDFANPAAVLTVLNRQFQMSQHGSKFFTIWYGVLDLGSGHLVYSSGGHPPAAVVGANGSARHLGTNGIAIGCVDWAKYENAETRLNEVDSVYVFSDGAYELRRADGLFSYEEFQHLLVTGSASQREPLESILSNLETEAGSFGFADDVSLLQVKYSRPRQ